ncbi:hypothetical protein MKY34_11350 [Sporosarcina sp. FSL K6-1522]|uniref:hypothetical protein n=1 Tax=Sporosarcina sp. FSL K6-1522 TaxID=2921554 RepID=UPI003159CCDC
MQETTNLKLKKPDLTDYVNVDDLNENADLIDAAITENKESLATHTADDTKHLQTGERESWNGKQSALPAENRRKITFGTAEPTGGTDGDIYFQYE